MRCVLREQSAGLLGPENLIGRKYNHMYSTEHIFKCLKLKFIDMADLPGLKCPWAAPSNRLPPIASLPSRPLTPRIAHIGLQNNNGVAPSSSASSAIPSTTRGNEWCKRRALAEHTTEDFTPLRTDNFTQEQQVSLAEEQEPLSYSTTNYLLFEPNGQLCPHLTIDLILFTGPTFY